MNLTSEAVEPLVRALAQHPALKNYDLRFLPLAEARFHEIAPGILTWDWCDRHKEERGKGSLAYYDLDGQIVSVGLVAAHNEVTEIELWRGDGNPVQSVPSQADLWEMVPGVIYSPRP